MSDLFTARWRLPNPGIGALILAFCVSLGNLNPRADAADVHDAIAKVQPRLVKLFGAGGLRNLAGYGTGFLVSSEGHIVTIWSHLLDADVVTVVLHDGRKLTGQVVATEARLDLALLKVDATNLPYFDLSKAGSAGPGSFVLAFGNMFKVAAGDEPLTVLHGVIAARTELAGRRGRYAIPYSGPVYLTDAVTNNPGAAGGVLTTAEGQLLGMLGREIKSQDSNVWLNYAMPIEELRPTIEDMIAGRYRRRSLADDQADTASSGLTDFDFGLVLVPDVVFRTPAYIETILPSTEAEDKDLRPDDLIVFANGELVNSIQVFQAILDGLVPGDDLQLVVRRGSSLVTVTLRVPKKN